ncbi:hypothetical protein F2Q68_00022598 [Brassica cretica]|uniref:Uncharacterized protein n=1 Tax=Brassica cretica TaxID=69181 RepID=A0A8S9FWL0_BRACR|nr:hypothetical protein F2Q68_00022598 [Brassica cretica]
MYSRRWDPGICVGDWFIKEFQERDSDDWKKGFPSNQSGIDLRFNKEILGKIRKWKLWIDRCKAPIIIKNGSVTWARRCGNVWRLERVRFDKLWWRPLRLRRWGERGLTWRLMEYTDWYNDGFDQQHEFEMVMEYERLQNFGFFGVIMMSIAGKYMYKGNGTVDLDNVMMISSSIDLRMGYRSTRTDAGKFIGYIDEFYMLSRTTFLVLLVNKGFPESTILISSNEIFRAYPNPFYKNAVLYAHFFNGCKLSIFSKAFHALGIPDAMTGTAKCI